MTKLKLLHTGWQPKQVDQIEHFATSLIDEAGERQLLLVLDYDGTLMPICQHPDNAVISSTIRSIIEKLIQAGIDIVILSGRSRAFLATQFKGLSVYLAAEHGAEFFDKHSWRCLANQNQLAWLAPTQEIISYYAQRVPQSVIESKNFGIAWHYRRSPAVLAKLKALELSEALERKLSGIPARLVHGNKVVEACAIEAHKGNFLHWFLERYKDQPFAIVAGDDLTDEDMFEVAQKREMISIKVGLGMSGAKYRLPKQTDVQQLLLALLAKA